jgi:hypothetical protein
MIDRRKIADLRLALIRANIKGGPNEADLNEVVRPVLGELLALADAALKIRKVCKQRQTAASMEGSRLVIVHTVVEAMRDLDELEGASHV